MYRIHNYPEWCVMDTSVLCKLNEYSKNQKA